jgi:hypothetical protein
MGLDEQLAHAGPSVERRAEDRRALAALDVHLDDEPLGLAGVLASLCEDVLERDYLDRLAADLVVRERARRLERVPPRRAHDVEFGPLALGPDRGAPDLPVDVLSVPGGRPVENREVHGLGLVRDESPRSPPHRVGRVVPLVRTDVHNDRVLVVRLVRLVDDDECERSEIDLEVVMRDEYRAVPVACLVDVGRPDRSPSLCAEQVDASTA